MNDQDIDVIERATAYQGYFRIDRYRLRHRKFDGGWTGEMTREVFDRGNVVGVLLYDPQRDLVVLIEQFRIGAHAGGRLAWMTEVVAGVIEPGESPEAVARREVVEETGCTVTDLVSCGGYLVSPGATNEHLALFCGRIDATGAGGVHGLDHEHEDIRVYTVPAAEAIALLDTERLDNSLIIIALGWFARNRENLRQRWAA